MTEARILANAKNLPTLISIQIKKLFSQLRTALVKIAIRLSNPFKKNTCRQVILIAHFTALVLINLNNT